MTSSRCGNDKKVENVTEITISDKKYMSKMPCDQKNDRNGHGINDLRKNDK